jgi:hypothetical protein
MHMMSVMRRSLNASDYPGGCDNYSKSLQPSGCHPFIPPPENLVFVATIQGNAAQNYNRDEPKKLRNATLPIEG